MKYLITLLTFAIGVYAVAQETYTYANPDRDFYDGRELYIQQKYPISAQYIEKFLNKREKHADVDLVQEAKYYQACNAYKMRQEHAATLLSNYVKEYPYTPYLDQCHFMMGNIAFENKQYNLAMEEYSNVKIRRLQKDEKDLLRFNQGYCYMQKDEYAQAKGEFHNIQNGTSKYKNSACYFYSYCDYALGNYDEALKGFQAIEGQDEYKDFVPYYIAQIYYKNKDYDKLMPYCEKILARKSNNANDAEVYRILGECAYQKEDYKKTISAMTEYEKRSKKVVRNDMYILGMSYYKTEDYNNAIKRLKKVTTEKDTLSQNAYLHLGNCYSRIDQKNNARMAYQTAAKMDFDKNIKEEAAYNYALSTYETTTPFGESIKAFESFLSEFKNSKYRDDIYERMVYVYMSSNNYAAANESLSKLSVLSPEMTNTKAYLLFQMGTEEFVKEDYVEAIDYFNQSQLTGTSNFDVAQVLYWRGESQYRLKKYTSARKDFMDFFKKKGAKDYANYNMANYNIGYTFFEEKNYKEAATYFLKYTENEQDKSVSTYTDAFDRLGDCYYSTRDLVNAERYYTKSMENGGNKADYATFQRAYVQGLRKNYSSKIKGLEGLINHYPSSEYVDDSYYEMGRAYVLSDKPSKAIDTYKTLISKYPESPLAKRASLEIGMIYYNQGNNDEAINAYKQVVARYPNSVETKTALESMEQIYVERNDVGAYFDYTRSIGSQVVVTNASREDSLTYLAAERLYMKGDTTNAIKALEDYSRKFCNDSKSQNCINSKFYLADCYFSNGRDDDAYRIYDELSNMYGNQHMETVLARKAQIAYDKQDYESSLEAFKRLEKEAQEPENITAAKLGVLRCSYLISDAQTTIDIANKIINDKKTSTETANEARLYISKAYLQTDEYDKALPHLQILAKNTKTEAGAESKYELANTYFIKGNDKKAEDEVTDFISQGTPHQYWLARAFILLSDIYIKRGDDFQAKQYLLSLQSNYKKEDSIQDLIKERLDRIEEREKENIE